MVRPERARLQAAASAIIAPVRIGVALPNYGPLAGPDVLVRLAQRAEELGADGIWVSDHLVAPVDARSVYPYGRGAARGPTRLGIIEEFYEPLVTLAFLAGQTRTVRLGVSAYVMPYRNPVLTAKQVATLDALSGGRVVLAIGTGWLREEFAALDVPFAGRGHRTEDYLAVCRALWAGGTAAYDGPSYRLPPVRTGPQPAQRPHPPIWIAGNSPAALAGTASTSRPPSWRRTSAVCVLRARPTAAIQPLCASRCGVSTRPLRSAVSWTPIAQRASRTWSPACRAATTSTGRCVPWKRCCARCWRPDLRPHWCTTVVTMPCSCTQVMVSWLPAVG
jgi:probable F420-dependent oxidoreductase